MERQNNQLTFLDNITSDLGGKRTAEFFRRIFCVYIYFIMIFKKFM